ncbi:MAG: glycosyltransferase family 4 protein [bacterium]|nr:glycosyltransferase family 4 protein [bacterium]
MRITHVTLRYPPASGGVEDYVHNLVERLRAEGDEVFVETTNLRTHHPATPLDPPPVDPPYVRRHPVRTLGPIAYPIPRGLSSHVSSLKPHIIHAHGFWYAPADIAARAARWRGVPFVLNPYYAPRAKWYWNAYRATVGRATLAAADAIVVISPQEEAALRRDRFPLRRVELIPPGIEPAEFTARRENPLSRRGLADKRVILFAGRLAHAKGLDLVLRALPNIVREIPAAHLAIAGEDFGEQESLQRLAESLGVFRAVTWLGKLPREELLAAYQHASAFVFPSRYEAFGISVLEAQAAGCPVVAANASALPFLVSDGDTGLLSRPEDPAHLAAAVLRLLNDRPLVERLARNGRTRALRDFTWDRSIEKLRTLYTDLTRSRIP